MYASTGLTPAARTRTTTCPGPTCGSATSKSRITSGPPNSSTRIAFIVSPYLELVPDLVPAFGTVGESSFYERHPALLVQEQHGGRTRPVNRTGDEERREHTLQFPPHTCVWKATVISARSISQQAEDGIRPQRIARKENLCQRLFTSRHLRPRRIEQMVTHPVDSRPKRLRRMRPVRIVVKEV